MNMEDTGYKVKGIAEIVAALVDSQLPNVEALFMEANNES